MSAFSDEKKKYAEYFMREALKECDRSGCASSHSGCVIVLDHQIIGKGTNSPPLNEKIDKCTKDDLPGDFPSDKTCCLHAEERAIMDALARNPSKLRGSTLYYIRKKEGKMVFAGKPRCTICSKMALDTGIREFVLLHEDGITFYPTDEYNRLSFAYRGE